MNIRTKGYLTWKETFPSCNEVSSDPVWTQDMLCRHLDFLKDVDSGIVRQVTNYSFSARVSHGICAVYSRLPTHGWTHSCIVLPVCFLKTLIWSLASKRKFNLIRFRRQIVAPMPCWGMKSGWCWSHHMRLVRYVGSFWLWIMCQTSHQSSSHWGKGRLVWDDSNRNNQQSYTLPKSMHSRSTWGSTSLRLLLRCILVRESQGEPTSWTHELCWVVKLIFVGQKANHSWGGDQWALLALPYPHAQ